MLIKKKNYEIDIILLCYERLGYVWKKKFHNKCKREKNTKTVIEENKC